MAILPFKEVKSALTEWLDANIDDKSDLNLIKHYLSDPEALAKVAKAMAKNEAQMEAKKNKIKSAKELIEQGDRKQRESGKDDMELEISPISEKGKLKREQNLDRQLADSMDNFISVARGLSFSSRPSNKEERIFLEQEYDGHCQICLKQIRKYNGEHYFEAINIIKFSKLPERLANSGKYGWNSLCLCPNCAAEYNYCSTDLVLYQKYTYEDVCRLLNWERNEVPLNIGGYKFDKKTKTFPIFINYDKQDDISDTTKYEDHFVGYNRLIAISKSGRTLDSEDVQNFLHAKERGIDVQLFVRKNKDDKISKEFYYLGRVNATGQVKEFVMPNTDKTAVESKAPHSYNDIVSEDSIKRNRTAIAGRTAMEIWTQEKTNVFKAIRLLGFLPEDKIDVEQYQQILETIFKENANILSSSNTSDRSSLKRMIRIYDFLLYRQKKTP